MAAVTNKYMHKTTPATVYDMQLEVAAGLRIKHAICAGHNAMSKARTRHTTPTARSMCATAQLAGRNMHHQDNDTRGRGKLRGRGSLRSAEVS
jgi:hypothetical protein